MMLRLFGLEFPVEAGQVRPPTASELPAPFAFSGTLQNNVVAMRGSFRLPEAHLTVLLEISLKVRAEGADLIPLDGILEHFPRLHVCDEMLAVPSASPAGVLIDYAAVRIERAPQNLYDPPQFNVVVRAGVARLVLERGGTGELPPEGVLLLSRPLPFSLHIDPEMPLGGPEAEIDLDLSAGVLTFGDGALRLVTESSFDLPIPSLQRHFRSKQRPVRRFALKPGEPATLSAPIEVLPLHVDVRDAVATGGGQTLLAPATATTADVNLTLSEARERRADRPALVSEIRLVPGAGASPPPPVITLHAYATNRNAPVALHLSNGIALGLRLGTASRPSAFLLTPEGDVAARFTADAKRLHSTFAPLNVDAPAINDSVVLRADRDTEATTHPFVVAALTAGGSAPSVQFALGESAGFRRPSLGRRLTAYKEKVVDELRFDCTEPELPIVPRWSLSHDQNLMTAHYARLNPDQPLPSRPTVPERHESGMKQAVSNTSTLELVELFRASMPAAVNESDVRLAEHRLRRDFGVLTLEHDQVDGAPLDFVYLDKAGNWEIEIGTTQLDLCPRSGGVKDYFCVDLVKKETDPANFWGVVKLGREVGLRQILAQVRPDYDPVNLDETLLDPQWTGLILFGVPLSLKAFRVLCDLAGAAAFEAPLDYLSLTPARDSGGPGICAFLSWNAQPNQASYDNQTPDLEAGVHLTQLRTRISDGRLAAFYAALDVSIASLFGRKHGVPKVLHIEGSYDTKNERIRFLGALDAPLDIFPEGVDGIGPIKQVSVRSAEIIADPAGGTVIDLAGDIVVKPIEVPSWSMGDGESKGLFRGLGISIPDATAVRKFLAFLYDRLKLEFTMPPFRLLDMPAFAIDLDGFSVNWKDYDGVGSLISLMKKGQFNAGALLTRLSLKLMHLPELFGGSLERLELLFGFALPLDGLWDGSTLEFMIGARGFDKLDLDLMRFLRLRAEHAQVTTINVAGRDAAWLSLEEVSLQILGKTLVEHLDFVLFANPYTGRPGVLLRFGSKTDLGLFEISWLLVGHDIRLSDDVARSLIALDPPSGTDLINQQKLLSDDGKKADFVPRESDDGLAAWVFAGGINVLSNFLIGKFLFQDRHYYGLALEGELFKEWFGYDFAIAALYVRRARPEEDSLIVSVRVPAVAVGPMAFQGGVITLEVQFGGGFMLDVGFPRLLSNGQRDWSRAFGAIITPLQASGGLYLGIRALTVRSTDPKTQVFEFGYAVQGGVGAAWGGGIFKVWGTIGVYAILEGSVAIADKQVVALHLVGAVGVLLRGGGELNWWIISVRIEVVAAAEARATIDWQRGNPVTLQLDFILYASVSAEACIGGGWFKICRGISVGLSLPYRTTLQIAR